MTEPHVVVLDGRWKQVFYRSIIEYFPAKWTMVASGELHHWLARPIDLVIVNDEFGSLGTELLFEFHRRAVPSLHIVDGIAEWRNLFENPRSSDEKSGMPLFQPVVADKVACLGPAQARLLAFLGGEGRCEVTGSPRFDAINTGHQLREPDGTFRFLVTTANTPGFTLEQTNCAARAIADIEAWSQSNRTICGRHVEVEWRVAQGFTKRSAERTNFSTLQAALGWCDAVVSTPSTVLLESMLCGKPTVCLDYTNSPALVPCAWSVTCEEQIGPTMLSVASGDHRRKALQDYLLRDALQCDEPATQRVATLMSAMIEAGRAARHSGAALHLPPRILPEPIANYSIPKYAGLHPGHPVFRETNILRLQTEVGHLRLSNRELERKMTQITSSRTWRTLSWLAPWVARILRQPT